MPLTVAELKLLDFGYLKGADLLQWCPAQLLIKQYEVDNASLQQAANFAYSEFTSATINRYDIAAELAKTAGNRAVFCVKLIAILAVRNAMGNMQNISEYMMDIFKGAKKDMMDIRNAQLNLPLAPPPTTTDTAGNVVVTESIAELVPSSFSTLG